MTIDRRVRNIIITVVLSTVVVSFLILSNSLIKQFALQERGRMKIWAHATERLAKSNVDADFEFLLDIIADNNSIPVLISDRDGNIMEFRNFRLPDKTDVDKSLFTELSERNRQYLQKRLDRARNGKTLDEVVASNDHFIEVQIAPDLSQYIYYEDSRLLKTLSVYPFIQVGVTMLLIWILYVAVLYTKRAEQNKLWVGLSKETAHQLGTPISSLMAWTEFLRATDIEPEVATEIDKDVRRLSTIADRFSKIGSMPEMVLEYVNETVSGSLDYMKSRVSGRVQINLHLSEDDHGVWISEPLIEWVMENLIKNAVDAMQGIGTIDISTGAEKNIVWIEVSDTGKGIARKNFKTVFRPGYTTKKRGWGLGLTLVKRIIEEYHGGKIYVKESEPGKRTTFRIELKQALPIKS